jgi:proteasome lid subunit RPN8/RPN11
MLVFTDGVIGEILSAIGQHAPERGCAILRPSNSNLVTHSIYDANAETTSTTYRPSARLTELVQKVEREEPVRYCGIVHSHPGDFDRPSGPDLTAFANALKGNPRLDCFVAPIVTQRPRDKHDGLNVVALGARARMTCYAAWRKDGGGVDIAPMEATVLPIDEAVANLTAALHERTGATFSVKSSLSTLNGVPYLTRALEGDPFRLTLLLPPSFPLSRPIALLRRRKGATFLDVEELAHDWRMTWDGGPALVDALMPSLFPNIKGA